MYDSCVWFTFSENQFETDIIVDWALLALFTLGQSTKRSVKTTVKVKHCITGDGGLYRKNVSRARSNTTSLENWIAAVLTGLVFLLVRRAVLIAFCVWCLWRIRNVIYNSTETVTLNHNPHSHFDTKPTIKRVRFCRFGKVASVKYRKGCTRNVNPYSISCLRTSEV